MSYNNTAQNYSQGLFQAEDHKSLSIKRAEELETLHANQIEKICSELPSGFFFSDNRLMYSPPEKAGNDDTQSEEKQPIYICSKLEVVAYIRDENNENYGKLLVFKDSEGKVHKWAMPMEFIVGEGAKYKAALWSRGLEISTIKSAQTLLSIYLAQSKPTLWIRCISQLGWYKESFILPDEALGNIDHECLIFQNQNLLPVNYTQLGTVQEWIANVSRLCIKNSRLEFAVSCAFAAPLLHLLNIESGGFHLRGQSSIGKSKILDVARSVWSDEFFLQRWNATINGLEAVAPGYNDSLLCLDEIAQIDSMIAGETAYMLANGRGKLRANKLGLSSGKVSWRILFLSNGEISLAEHMMKSCKQAKAGQEIRILDIPATAGNFGCFEELHGYASGESFADGLSEASSRYFGTVSRAYINKIIADREFAISFSKRIQKNFIEKNKPINASGQVVRALNRFAVTAAGGELATEYGLTGWEKGAATEGIDKCFTDWLIARGGAGNQEKIRALKQVCNFFGLHWRDKFENWDTKIDSDSAKYASFRKIDQQGRLEFFVHPLLFRTDICSGNDSSTLAKWCIEDGFILPSTDGKFTRSEHVSINKIKGRYYRFTAKVLEEHTITGDL